MNAPRPPDPAQAAGDHIEAQMARAGVAYLVVEPASRKDGPVDPTDAQIAAVVAFLDEEPEPRGYADVRDFFGDDPNDPPPGPKRDAALAAMRAADQAAEAEYKEWARRLLQAAFAVTPTLYPRSSGS